MSIQTIHDNEEHIKCNMCGKEFTITDKYFDARMDLWPGYGSNFDGNRYNISLCCDCADDVLEYMLSKCKINPIVDDDYMSHTVDIDNVIHKSWGPGKTICREPLLLGEKVINNVDVKQIRAYGITTCPLADNKLYNAISILLNDGSYLNEISRDTSYEKYFDENANIRKEEWESIDLGKCKWGETVLHIKKTDMEWFKEKIEPYKKANEMLKENRSAYWVNAFEEKINEEKLEEK